MINFPIIFLILSTFTSICVFILMISKRNAEKSLFLIYISLAMILSQFGYLFEAFAQNLTESYDCVIVKYFGTPYVSVFALLFVLDFYDHRPSTLVSVLLFLPAAVNTYLVASWRSNGIYYKSISYYSGEYFTQTIIVPNPIYYFFISYLYVLLVAALFCVFRYGFAKGANRTQAASIAISISCPIVTNLLYLFKLTPNNIDILPYSYLISLLVLTYAVMKLNIFNVLPLAKETALDNMKDALIVVDSDQNYLYSNIAAKKMFPDLSEDRLMDQLSALLNAPKHSGVLDADAEVELSFDGKKSFFRVSKSNVVYEDKYLGACIVLYDVTQSKHLMNRLNHLAKLDSLTQIYNRGSFMNMAMQGVEIAKVNRYSYSLLVIDIDRFKLINDTHGHSVGDTVLKDTVHLIKTSLRHGDVLGRIGGEEFAVFLNEITYENSIQIAERIRRDVEKNIVVYEEVSMSVTVSVGLAYFRTYMDCDIEHLVAFADEAMYRAKKTGRNRLVHADISAGMDIEHKKSV